MMNTCSSMTGFAESSEIPEAYVVDDNFIGENPWHALKISSLPRSPDSHSGASYLHENGYNLQSSSGLNCLSDPLLVLWNQALICYYGECVYALGRWFPDCYRRAILIGYVQSQGEIWLNRTSFMVNLICRNGFYISALLRFQSEFAHLSSETFSVDDIIDDFHVIAKAVTIIRHILQSFKRLLHAKLTSKSQAYISHKDMMAQSLSGVNHILVILSFVAAIMVQRRDSLFACYSHKSEHYFSKLQSIFGPYIGVYMSQVTALKAVTHSGGLNTLLWFLFGSLSRPPEAQEVAVSSSQVHMGCFSQ